MIKYTRYAKNQSGKIIKAEKGMNANQTFICLGCGEVLGAYAVYTSGERSQIAHFRHIGNTGQEGRCGNYESYMHNYAKRKFAENYKYSERFDLKWMISIKCNQAKYNICSSLLKDTVNLKERYPYIKIEKRDGSFIPDCLIYNDNGDKIYIEIKYESPVSEKKRNSGIPIMEIKVNTEESIQKIIHNGLIDASSEDVNLINFESISPNSTLIYDCGGNCPKENISISCREGAEDETPGGNQFAHMSSKDKLIGNIIRNKPHGSGAYNDWQKRIEKKYSTFSGKDQQQSKKNKCETKEECNSATPEQKTFDF